MRRSFTRFLGVLWTSVAMILSAVPAWADLGSASAAYKKGDFAGAFEQFKELAELGQPTAQYNLAVMYAHGEGVAMSNTNAHAWASLAAAGGEESAAANASRRDFRAATKAQGQALAEAKRLDWDLTALNQRQSLYASGQAWSGDVLAF